MPAVAAGARTVQRRAGAAYVDVGDIVIRPSAQG